MNIIRHLLGILAIGAALPVTAQNIATAVEFTTAGQSKHFLTSYTFEQNIYDNGGTWSRSGKSFRVWMTPYAASNLKPVCRFTGANGSPDVRYYTVDSAQCSTLKTTAGVSYEGVAFYAKAPSNGACEAADTPVYLAYNGKGMTDGMNFRYLTDSATYQGLAGQGWSLLGVAFCGPGAAVTDKPRGDFLNFVIQVQDFSYTSESIATLRRLLTLHETYKIPLDVYFTSTMLDAYESQAPDLLALLKASPYVAIQYLVQQPKPYVAGFDWAGLSAKSATDQYSSISNYETHGIDLSSGQPTTATGGYGKLKSTLGEAPLIAAFNADTALASSTAKVFKDLGALLTSKSGVYNLGDSANNLYLKPEHSELNLASSTSSAAATLIANAFSAVHLATGNRAPFVVAIRMSDNDFVAKDSAWNTVYGTQKTPPWSSTSKAAAKTTTEQQAVWTQYEAALSHASQKSATLGAVNGAGVKALYLNSSIMPKLYISGTLHFESSSDRWPKNADDFIAFMTRATAAGKVGSQTSGMKWSIGADIGWLTGETRAKEVVQKTSALGVEWDVHAHSDVDRARAAETIAGWGGKLNAVASGLTVTEIDGLRTAKTSSSGYKWQADVFYGLVKDSGHGVDSDDYSFGFWRPTSSADYYGDDPAQTQAVVGGGPRDWTKVESFANQLAAGGFWQPVYSATVMVQPATLTVADYNFSGFNSTYGIAEIESWAARLGALAVVKWGTYTESAAAWRAAGEIPSRVVFLSGPTVATTNTGITKPPK